MKRASSKFVTSGSYPTRGGNMVRPLIDGEPAFGRICEAIESGSDDRAALRQFRRIAGENRQRHQNGKPNWQGNAFSLDIATYGRAAQF